MARAGLAALLLAGLLGGCGHGGAAPTSTPTAKSSSPVVTQHRVAPRQLDLTVRSAALGRPRRCGSSPRSAGRSPRRSAGRSCTCCTAAVTRTRAGRARPTSATCRSCATCSSSCPRAATSASTPTGRTGRAGRTSTCASCRGSSAYGAGPRRAIAGLSMGGLGAMDYAARRPRMFRAAASFSGVLHPLGVPRFWLGLFSSYTSDPREVWGDPDSDRATWRRHDPTSLLPALKGLPLFVSAGDGAGREARRDRGRGGGGVTRVRAPRAGAPRPAPRRALRGRDPRLAVLAARAAPRAAAAPRPAPLGGRT